MVNEAGLPPSILPIRIAEPGSEEVRMNPKSLAGLSTMDCTVDTNEGLVRKLAVPTEVMEELERVVFKKSPPGVLQFVPLVKLAVQVASLGIAADP